MKLIFQTKNMVKQTECTRYSQCTQLVFTKNQIGLVFPMSFHHYLRSRFYQCVCIHYFKELFKLVRANCVLLLYLVSSILQVEFQRNAISGVSHVYFASHDSPWTYGRLQLTSQTERSIYILVYYHIKRFYNKERRCAQRRLQKVFM